LRATRRNHRFAATIATAALLAILGVIALASSASAGTGGATPDASTGDEGAQTQQTTRARKAKIRGRIAIPPASAPERVKAVIRWANKITRKPYRYGGGHARFRDTGYDCSGALSFALHGGRFIDSPVDATGFFPPWGKRGKGKWITVYTNNQHAFMVVAGRRFDTSSYGSGGRGPRWRKTKRPTGGFMRRHPAGF
jgi:hypothetical protein